MRHDKSILAKVARRFASEKLLSDMRMRIFGLTRDFEAFKTQFLNCPLMFKGWLMFDSRHRLG